MAKRDLVRLLVKLYGDPKLRERFEKDPARVIKAAKLSAKERAVLASGDPEAIRAHLGKESLKAQIIQAPAIIVQSATKKKPG